MGRYSGNILRAALPGASTAAASGNWELEDAVQQIGSGAWPAAVGTNDPNFYRNALLLTGDGTNGGQNNTFLDSSTNNFTITRNGNATQGSFTPFGGANYSTYFDGSSYLSFAHSPGFNIDGVSATIECWFFPISSDATPRGVISHADSSASWTGWQLNWQNQKFVIETNSGGTTGLRLTGATTVTLNTWHHVAIVKSGTTFNLYVDGVLDATSTSSLTTNISTAVRVGAERQTSPSRVTGYISNTRIINGVALYTSTFTPPTAPLNTTNNTTLLVSASEKFEDLSATSSAATTNGSPRVTEFSPFNSYNSTPVSYSAYLNGTTDFLTTATAPNLTGDFTIEAWVFQTAQSTFEMICGSGPNYWAIGSTNNFEVAIGSTPAYPQFTSGSAFPLNQWVHVALCRSGTSLRAFINGTQIGATATNSNAFFPTGTFYIGQQGQANFYYYHGNISNFRIVKGTALYTANFTPSTTPLTAVANTFLLTCQDTTFRDNSTNAAAITVNGSARPVKANPFGYTITSGFGYSPATMGGSAYFDGTGDYLDLPNNAVFSQSGAWTVEMWVYPNSNPTSQYWFSQNTANFFQISTNASGFVAIDKSGVGVQITATTATQVNAWNHVAMVSNGTTLYLFVNGILQGSASVGTTATSAATTRIGAYQGTGGLALTGYISNVRMLKGTALYTSSFVPPASPVTAVTNTQLLMNFTNGSMFDYAVGNTFETVGAAQINTTTKKFGTGSMSFNGTTSYLQGPYSPTLSFGSGNFTIEGWIYLNALPSVYAPIMAFGASNSTTTTDSAFNLVINSAARIVGNFYTSTQNNQLLSATSSISTGTWIHIAAVRNGNTLTAYINGTASGSTTTVVGGALLDASTYVARVGAVQLSSTFYYLNGFIDDLRVSRYARYTANFTPPGQLQIF